MTSYTLLYSSAMAEQQTQFAYHNIQLYKSESLGSGSYGGVCKAKCDGLLCAAKIMHPTLFDLHDPGTASYLRKFREECHLLSLARHPNVVQYLATYYDPDTRLPVLLMELCDESLTAFLERSPGPLSYHVQLNICLDIALALVYLHSNGVIHRDLTGNNVLMIAGTRAKITDFGMSKLATGNPRMTALTLCPGNPLYMPPEALDKGSKITHTRVVQLYTAKLDIFSFGVIVIQILTRQFPNPTDRFRTVHGSQNDEDIEDDKDEENEDEDENDEESDEEEVRRVVPETERRQAHLQLIPDTHSLKPLALQCLKKKKRSRPSALRLSARLSELKQAPQYTQSMHQAQTRGGNETGDEIATLRRQVQEVQQQNIDKEQLNQQLQQQLEGQRILTEDKTREASEHWARSTQLQRMVEAKDRECQENQQTIEEKQLTIATNKHVIETKERQLQQTQQQLRESQQLVKHNSSEIQQLQQQLRDQSIAKAREASEHQACSTRLQRMVEAKDRQLQENHYTIATKQHAIETKERQLQQRQQQLRDSQQLVEQFQQRLQHKDKTISDLQQTISHHEREREIQQLKQQDIASSIQPQQLPVTAEKTQTAKAVSVAQKDISKMTWREGKKAPEGMRRGAAVVHGNTAYFTQDFPSRNYSVMIAFSANRPAPSRRVYSYQNISGNEQWSRLPDNPNEAFGLAVIDGLLTSVGGRGPTNTLLSLTGKGERKKWSEVFPPMPTPRSRTACITTEEALVVAGGRAGGDLATVEVMDINTKQWTTVCPLPKDLQLISGIICGDSLYLAGGIMHLPGSTHYTVYLGSKSVFTCSLPDLWQPEALGSRIRRTLTRSNVWKEISSLPVTDSTLASFGGHLLAIGGDDSWNPTTDVYRYDSHTDSWHVINRMKNKRSQCLAVTLPEDQLIIVGGKEHNRIFRGHTYTDSVEILEDK